MLDSNWADEIRDQRRDTGRGISWTFGWPRPAMTPAIARTAPVVAQIENDARILGNRKLSDSTRAEALRFLIHFVADVHQPLHAEDNGDRGGNQVRVEIGRERGNLHHVWDQDVVEALGPSAIADDIVRTLSPAERKAWAAGTPAVWANESHTIARDQIYPPLMGRRALRLPRDYAWREAPLTRMLLAKAGLRLAFMINTALK